MSSHDTVDSSCPPPPPPPPHGGRPIEGRRRRRPKNQCPSCFSDAREVFQICHDGCKVCDCCVGNFINAKLGEGSAFSMRCRCCNKSDVLDHELRRNMTDMQESTYEDLSLIAAGVFAGESLYSCRFCHVRVFLLPSPGELFFDCESCKVSYCMHCKKQCKSEREREPHVFQCGGLRDQFKTDVEQIVGEGGIQPCPKCGLMGRKDSECTRITCPNVECQTLWCYICGLERERWDGSVDMHSSGWEDNPRRCPMYLHLIHAKNSTWPESDDAAADHFHRRNLLWKLRLKLVESGEADMLGDMAESPEKRRRVAEEATLQRGKEMMNTLMQDFPRILGNHTIDEIVAAEPPRDY